MFLTVLTAAFLASIADLSGLFLFWRKGWAVRYSNFLVSFAAGALLGAAFLELLPEVLHEGGSFSLVVLGILLFYFLERIIFLHHSHPDHFHQTGDQHLHERGEVRPYTYLMLAGNTLHDFVDGAIIALTFLIEPALGLVTTVAVIAHEFPSGIGEFSVLIRGGFRTTQALLYTVLTILATPLGALLTLLASGWIEPATGVLLALATGGFIYIAAVDLIPEMHREFDRRRSVLQGIFLVFGILVIYGVGLLAGH